MRLREKIVKLVGTIFLLTSAIWVLWTLVGNYGALEEFREWDWPKNKFDLWKSQANGSTTEAHVSTRTPSTPTRPFSSNPKTSKSTTSTAQTVAQGTPTRSFSSKPKTPKSTTSTAQTVAQGTPTRSFSSKPKTPKSTTSTTQTVAQGIPDVEPTSFSPNPSAATQPPKPIAKQPSTKDKPKERLAFATFLSQYALKKKFKEDMFFVTVRILAYQFLYARKTRGDIPFLVISGPGVEEWKLKRLSQDGAIVVPIEHINTSWAAPKGGPWKYVLDKIHLFNMTEYDRICFLDADTVLRERISSVFDDQAAQIQKSRRIRSETQKDEARLPKEYLMAAKSESSGHATRSLDERTMNPKSANYLNAGFFILKPSHEIFAYYLSVLKHKFRFFPLFPEQNMFNYAHRRYGNMPWTSLKWDWNVHNPTRRDFKTGVKSLHGHLWDGGLLGYPGKRNKYWKNLRRDMEAFHKKRDKDLLKNSDQHRL